MVRRIRANCSTSRPIQASTKICSTIPLTVRSGIAAFDRTPRIVLSGPSGCGNLADCQVVRKLRSWPSAAAEPCRFYRTPGRLNHVVVIGEENGIDRPRGATSVRSRPFRPPSGHKKNDRLFERGLSRGERLRAWILRVCSIQRCQVFVAGPIARASGRPGFLPDIANVFQGVPHEAALRPTGVKGSDSGYRYCQVVQPCQGLRVHPA